MYYIIQIERHLKLMILSTLMSIAGQLIFRFIREYGLARDFSSFQDDHGLTYFWYIILISNCLWLVAYHKYIKFGINFKRYVKVSLIVPFVGCNMVIPFWGILFFIGMSWILFPISLITCYLIGIVVPYDFISKVIKPNNLITRDVV